MISIELKPLLGINIQSKSTINLGQQRDEIESILGSPHKVVSHRHIYAELELAIDYDKNNRVEFIEFIYGPFPKKTQLSIYDENPFKLLAKDLINLLYLNNNGTVDDSEAEYCYAFKEISVGIWRGATPSDIESAIEELKKGSKYEGNKSDIEDELRQANHFWTIGIGRAGYYL